MKKSIIKTLSTVFILTAISKVLGFLREVVFANIFGTSIDAAAYSAALKIPTQIVDIVLSSAIVSCFVPVFNEILQKKGKEDANKFAGNFINIVAVIATSISVLGMIFAPILVNLLTSFSPETYELTVNLVRITFPMVIFTAMAFSFVGFLQSYGEFNVPAGISGLSNLVVIVSLLTFGDKLSINGVCYIIVFAWLLQLLVQLPFAKKFGYDFKFKIDFKDENIKKVFKLAIPILFSTAVLPINNLVSMKFASGLGDLSYSSLEYAYKLYVVVYGIFSYAIGNIIFPELSKAISGGDKEGYVYTIKKAIRIISFLLIPLTIGIMFYSKDVVSLAYERGNFDATSTLFTSNALLFYSVGIIGAGIVEIMNKSFYAKQDTKTPLFVGIAMIALNIILIMIFKNFTISHGGIPLANAIVALINAVTLSIIISAKTKHIFTKDIFIHILKVIISSIVMFGVIYLINIALKDFNEGMLQNILRVCVGTGGGVVTYFVLTYLLKSNEFLTKKASD